MKHAIIPALGILLLELPKGATNVTPCLDENNNVAIRYTLKGKDYIYTLNQDENVEYIAPFKAMSEEMFDDVMDKLPKVIYNNDNTVKEVIQLTARESFLSAVEAEGYYFQNPYGYSEDFPPVKYRDMNADEYISKWHEAQSRTFDPALTHVFNLNQKTNE